MINGSGNQYSTQLFIGSSIDDLPLTAIEFRILCKIARRGECTESARSMAEACFVSERTIRLTLRFLTKAGLITETERTGQATIRRLAAPENWQASEGFEGIRKSITGAWTGKQTPATTDRGKEQEKAATPATGDRGLTPAMSATPATTDADPCNQSSEPLQPQTQTPATTFDKGIPIKETQESNPEKVLVPDGTEGDTALKDLCFEEFSEAYRGRYESPYVSPDPKNKQRRERLKADFVQYSGMVSRLGSKFTFQFWQGASMNYFLTARSKHTMADLCANIDTFAISPLDRFNRPTLNGSTAQVNGISGLSAAGVQTAKNLAQVKQELFGR